MPRTRLTLSIDVGSDPIQGWCAADQQRAQPFHGWVELAAAIEAARVARTPRADLATDEQSGRIHQRTDRPA